MKKLLACLLVAAACGGGGGSNDTPGDDTPGADAAIDSPPSPMITISGTASERGINGATPLAGATITAHTNADENTAIATAMTDAAGAFTLTFNSNGQALNGFLKGTKAGYTTSYLYPPEPVSADLAMVPMNMVTTNSFDLLSTLAQGNQQPANGMIAVIVVGGTMTTSPPVGGATISSMPASNPYRYNGSNGLPSSTATSTRMQDGIGYGFNAPVGMITVTAAKSGSTFKTTTLKSRAMALTQTLIIQ